MVRRGCRKVFRKKIAFYADLVHWPETNHRWVKELSVKCIVNAKGVRMGGELLTGGSVSRVFLDIKVDRNGNIERYNF